MKDPKIFMPAASKAAAAQQRPRGGGLGKRVGGRNQRNFHGAFTLILAFKLSRPAGRVGLTRILGLLGQGINFSQEMVYIFLVVFRSKRLGQPLQSLLKG